MFLSNPLKDVKARRGKIHKFILQTKGVYIMVKIVMAARSRDIPDPGDQRYFPRWEVENRILYKLENSAEPHTGTTKDLSCAGARLTTKDPLLPRQRLKLTIRLSLTTEVVVNGRVIWQDQTRSPYPTGVAFYNTSGKAQETILQHAFEIDREKVLNQWFRGWDGAG